jgi:hypothetical protein
LGPAELVSINDPRTFHDMYLSKRNDMQQKVPLTEAEKINNDRKEIPIPNLVNGKLISDTIEHETIKAIKFSDKTKNNLFNIYVQYSMYKFEESKG